MTSVLRGPILHRVPFFKASIERGTIRFHDDGNLRLTVDTGFTGSIALPQGMIEQMRLQLIGHENFALATGDLVRLPMFLGAARFHRREQIQAWFIPGDFLLGMEFFASMGSRLVLDFAEEMARLLK